MEWFSPAQINKRGIYPNYRTLNAWRGAVHSDGIEAKSFARQKEMAKATTEVE